MDTNYTTKTQEALSSAVRRAATNGNAEVQPVHLLQALLEQTDGIAVALLDTVGADRTALDQQVAKAVADLPRASGSSVSGPTMSNGGYRVISAAGDLAKQRGDEYISTEHLLIALAEEGDTATILARQGATPDALIDALGNVRGGSRVTTADPGRHRKLFDDLGEDLAALGILSGLFVTDRAPLGVAGHGEILA